MLAAVRSLVGLLDTDALRWCSGDVGCDRVR
jgi:hypothetical protein